MANVMLSPTMTAKLKAKEYANKIRHGSPKLQEVLRERCRQRMKEKREQLFNKRRLSLNFNAKDVQDTLTEIVRKEFNNLATTDLDDSMNSLLKVIVAPLAPDEALELENEIVAEEEQWILEEYEKMSKEEMEFLATAADEKDNEVVCPMCQKSNIVEGINCIFCKACSLKLDNCHTVKELKFLLDQSVQSHSNICNETPGFSLILEETNTGLYMICTTCSTMVSVA